MPRKKEPVQIFFSVNRCPDHAPHAYGNYKLCCETQVNGDPKCKHVEPSTSHINQCCPAQTYVCKNVQTNENYMNSNVRCMSQEGKQILHVSHETS